MKKNILLFAAAIQLAQLNISAQNTNDSLRMDSILHAIPELTVEGKRPVVKAKEGKLVYNMQQLIENKGVDNAYDAIKQLPLVTESIENG